MTRLTLTLIALLSTATLQANAQPGNPTLGKKTAAQMCAVCHGLDGRATLPQNPKLAGQNYEYLVNAINSMRMGQRASAQICSPMVKALQSQQIADVAAYFASSRP